MKYILSTDLDLLNTINEKGPWGINSGINKWGVILKHPELNKWAFDIKNADLNCFLLNQKIEDINKIEILTEEELLLSGWLIV